MQKKLIFPNYNKEVWQIQKSEADYSCWYSDQKICPRFPYSIPLLFDTTSHNGRATVWTGAGSAALESHHPASGRGTLWNLISTARKYHDRLYRSWHTPSHGSFRTLTFPLVPLMLSYWREYSRRQSSRVRPFARYTANVFRRLDISFLSEEKYSLIIQQKNTPFFVSIF